MKYILLNLFLILTLNSFSQNIVWTKKFGGIGDDRVFKSLIDNQNNLYLIGHFNGTINIGSGYTSYGTGNDIFIAKYSSEGNLLWFRQVGSTDYDDFVDAIALSPDQNKIIIVGGYFGSICNFGDGFTLDNVDTGTAECFLTSIECNTGSILNTKKIAYGVGHQRPQAIESDINGNLIILGYILGDNLTSYFSPTETFTCSGPQNYFILKLGPDLTIQWIKKIIGNDNQNKLFALNIDENGYYIAGTNKNTLNLDILTLNSQGGTSDFFLYKINSEGTGQWVRRIKGSGADVSVYATCDQQGHVYISGYYASTDLKVDSTASLPSVRTVPNKGSNDIFFAKYSTDGTLQWFDVAGSKGDDKVTRLSTDGENVVIAGQFSGKMVFNNEVLIPTLKAVGDTSTDAIGIVHDKNDNLIYAIKAGGTGTDVAQSCVIDSEGNYIFTGNFYSSTLKFDNNPAHDLVNGTPTTRDVFIAKYKSRSISFAYDSIRCPGTTTGSLTANAKGAWVGNKNYLWSKDGAPGFSANTPTITNLGAGTYHCRISDDLHFETASITIADPAPIALSVKTKTDATCFEASNGYLEANVSGGTGTKKYVWSGTGNGVKAANIIQNTLSAGTYSLTVYDYFNCSATLSNMVIGQPQKIVFKNTTVKGIDGTPGNVNLTVQGGTTAYIYSWTGPSGFTASTQDIAALATGGNYKVSVTDSKSCNADTTVLVVDGSLTATITNLKKVTCFGFSDGSLTVTPYTTNPTPVYTYSWTGPSGFTANTATITGLIAGTYSVIVTDTQPEPDKTFTISGIVVSQPSAVLAASIFSEKPKCTGDINGFVDVNPTGGTLPYTYSWKKDGSVYSGTTEVITGIGPGNYEVTVTDINSCNATASAIVSDPFALTLNSAPITHVTCSGLKNDGAISLNISGGTGSYTFRWSNGLTTQNINLLGAGTYICNITDANKCLLTTQHTVGQPAPITASFSNVNVACYGGANGAIDLTPNGGNVGSYTYEWSNGSVSQDLSGLTAGDYSVTITDSKNCEKSFSTSLSQSTELTISPLLIQDANCNGAANGSVSVNTTGGTTPYIWTWSNNKNGSSINNLLAGSYTVTVIDGKNCTKSATYNVSEPSVLTVSEVFSSHTNVLCNGGGTGALEVSATGSSGTYQYSMDGINWQTSGLFSNLVEGSYTLSVRDKDVTSCTNSLTSTITQPPAIIINTPTVSDITCNGLTNGAISVSASGGNGAMSYLLKVDGNPSGNVSGVGNGIFTNLTASSNYTVEATDANNCKATTAVLAVAEPTAITLSNIILKDITCNGSNDGSIEVSSSGGTGTLQHKLFLGGIETGNISGLSSGSFTNLAEGTTYTVEATDANNCKASTAVLAVAEPAVITLSNIILKDITCNGSDDGSIEISSSGGTGTLQHKLFLGGIETGNISGLSSGSFTNLAEGTTYTVEATDANNCKASTAVLTVAEPAVITLSNIILKDITCNGSNDGSIEVSSSGGTGTLQHKLFLDGIETGNISGLSSGSFTNLSKGTTYTIEATDANNCIASTAVLAVTEPTAITLSNIIVKDITCNGLNNGSIEVSSSGGTGTLQHKLFLNGAETGNTTGLFSGIFADLAEGNTYMIEVYDANNCSKSTTSDLTIINPQALSLGITNTADAICAGTAGGSVSARATGGTGTLTYKLLRNNLDIGNTSGSSTGDFTGLFAGNDYTIEVSDVNSCNVTSAGFIISEPPAINIVGLIPENSSCHDKSNGSVTVQANGGTGPLSYRLLLNGSMTTNFTGASSATFTGLAAASPYRVDIYDSNGCAPVSTSEFAITEPAAMTFSDLSPVDATCFGANDGMVGALAVGGSGTLTYQLYLNGTLVDNNTGQQSGVFTGLSAGTNYTIQVSDNNQCDPVSSAVFNIVEPAKIVITAENATRTSGSGLADGSITVVSSGGAGSLTYKLNNIAQSSGLFSGLSKGTYQVFITDANNCGPVSSSVLIIDDPTSVDFIKNGAVRLYPNPTTEKVFVEVNNGSMDELKVELKNITGQASFLQIFEHVSSGFKAQIDLQRLPKGIYVMIINNVVAKEKLIVQ